MTQREVTNPDALAIMAVMHAKHGGGTYSATKIEGFEKGWSVIAFMKAHYFEAYQGVIFTKCGKAWTMNTRAAIWKPHRDTPRCKRCVKLAPTETPSTGHAQEKT